MGLEFLAGRSDDDKQSYDSRKNFSLDCHVLNFRYSDGDSAKIIGGLLLRPQFAIAYLFWENHKTSNRLRGLCAKLQIDYADMLAKILNDTPQELLERKDGFVNAYKLHFPNVQPTDRNADALNACGRIVAAESVLIYKLTELFPNVVLEGEPLVDFMLNEQGKKYGLSFYNKVKKGLNLRDLIFGFGDPRGTVKGVLLHRGYSPFTVPGREARWYFKKDKAPVDMKACSPFST